MPSDTDILDFIVSLATVKRNTLWSGCLSSIVAVGGVLTCDGVKIKEAGANF